MGMFVVAPSTHHLSDHSLGVGVVPLVTAGGRTGNPSIGNNNNIQFWQHSDLRKPLFSDHRFLHDGGDGSASTSGSTMTCQDCGNQAKKDCTHRRCRTCCKSRGFDCATHVKSTWVPAARRRERQLITSAGDEPRSSASTSGTKKPRMTSQTTTSHTSTSNTSPSSSHHQDASFMQSLPGQVRAPAVFKCVRVTAVEDGDDEYAYQASVTIGGHLFKGFLYDQGVGTRQHANFPNLSELHLGGGSLTSPAVEPPETYGSSGGGLIGGSSYGNRTS